MEDEGMAVNDKVAQRFRILVESLPDAKAVEIWTGDGMEPEDVIGAVETWVRMKREEMARAESRRQAATPAGERGDG